MVEELEIRLGLGHNQLERDVNERNRRDRWKCMFKNHSDDSGMKVTR